MLCISHALFRATLVHFHLNNFVTISIPLVRLSMNSRVNLSSVGLVEETDTWFRMKFSAFHFYNLMIDNWNYAGVQPVQDPGEPSGEMALVNEWMNEWMREERIEADIPWFTQKANKAPRQGTCFVHVGHRHPPDLPREWRRRAPSCSGLRSPGK